MADALAVVLAGVGAAVGVAWEQTRAKLEKQRQAMNDCRHLRTYFTSLYDDYRTWTVHCEACGWQRPRLKEEGPPPPGSLIRTKRGDHQVPPHD